MSRRAVVVGGSMVGLAVARACRDHFDEVVVVERDTFPTGAPDHRRGVPQSRHVHNLMLRGQRELERLFPGYRQRALSLGATEVDHGRETARCTQLGWMPLFDAGFTSLSATRPLLEHAEREMFREHCPNVVVLEGTRVTEAQIEGSGPYRVTGVHTDHADPRWTTIEADLVVDCSGRRFAWKKWFADAGLPPVKETIVDSHCGYATRLVRHPNPASLPWRGMAVDSVYPDAPRWGVIVPVEDGCWLVTLGGFNKHYPAGTPEGFESFAHNLLTPAMWQVLAQTEPVGDVHTFRRMEMRWNHFERYSADVRGFLAVGDSAFAFNPLYGQGMTAGLGCATALLDELDHDSSLSTLQRRYYRRAAAFAGPPWRTTAMRDLRWPGSDGKPPWHARISMPLSELILRAAHDDPPMWRRVLAVAHLVEEPTSLLRPRAAWLVARYLLRRLTGARLPATASPSLPPDASNAE